MTIQGVSSWYSTSSIFSSTKETSASTALAQLLASSTSSTDGTSGSTDSSTVSQMPPPPPPSSTDMQAALDKLKQVDPTLASKMEQFNKQMDTLKENVKRLRITANRELPGDFAVQGALHAKVEGRNALVSIADAVPSYGR